MALLPSHLDRGNLQPRGCLIGNGSVRSRPAEPGGRRLSATTRQTRRVNRSLRVWAWQVFDQSRSECVSAFGPLSVMRATSDESGSGFEVLHGP